MTGSWGGTLVGITSSADMEGDRAGDHLCRLDAQGPALRSTA